MLDNTHLVFVLVKDRDVYGDEYIEVLSIGKLGYEEARRSCEPFKK